jgi:hypothetical protein
MPICPAKTPDSGPKKHSHPASHLLRTRTSRPFRPVKSRRQDRTVVSTTSSLSEPSSRKNLRLHRAKEPPSPQSKRTSVSTEQKNLRLHRAKEPPSPQNQGCPIQVAASSRPGWDSTIFIPILTPPLCPAHAHPISRTHLLIDVTRRYYALVKQTPAHQGPKPLKLNAKNWQ